MSFWASSMCFGRSCRISPQVPGERIRSRDRCVGKRPRVSSSVHFGDGGAVCDTERRHRSDSIPKPVVRTDKGRCHGCRDHRWCRSRIVTDATESRHRRDEQLVRAAVRARSGQSSAAGGSGCYWIPTYRVYQCSTVSPNATLCVYVEVVAAPYL